VNAHVFIMRFCQGMALGSDLVHACLDEPMLLVGQMQACLAQKPSTHISTVPWAT